MNSIVNKAKDLLESNSVQLVIGYENGSNGSVRASFITNPYDTQRLIYDNRCTQNLAVYLLKNEIKKYESIAVIANIAVMRSIMMLASENQIKENNIKVIPVSLAGSVPDFANWRDMANYLADNCPDNPDDDQKYIDRIKGMSIEERWDFWTTQLSECFKCYACRSACPMCYCSRCTVECNQPQWIPVPPHPVGNLDWHIMRTMHLAGRCVSCGECGRACPLDIPVHLLTMFMADEMYNVFGVKAGLSEEITSVLSAFKPDDKENFII